MSLTDEERKVIVRREYEKALQCYQQAEANFQMQIWEVVANRLYYAVFHGVTSLLIKDGHKVSTHKGVVMSFGLHYVATGMMTDNEGRLYSQLQTIREKADYNCIYQVEKTEVEKMMPLTEQLLAKIGDLVNVL
ncbi:HEPN domain-containing protein [uncultured Bacteroides sp.]|uniref:HEPN domain-containing protein n=1 Tax=uncultured Bacteroides sp. TaxID=162156 RepID=UPI0026195A5B|nr:HEPN domain-containing protein [uncultured Bacteroides sp.]